MKKLLAILLVALFAIGAVSCAAPAATTPTEDVGADVSASEAPASEAPSSAAPTGDADDGSLQKVLDAGQLILGLDDSFPPMGFKDEDGEIKGFDIDLATEVCKRLGVELVLQPIDWNSKEIELNGGTIDCIWNGMSIDEERKEKMSLSNPYMENTQAIVVKAGSDIKTKADLAGKVVGVQAGSTAMTAVEKEPEVLESFGEFLDMKDNVMALMELANGTVDAVVADSVLVQYYTSKEADAYTILDENFGSEQYAIGFRKEDIALTNAVNDALKEMQEDGTFKTISEKWFGRDVSIAQ